MELINKKHPSIVEYAGSGRKAIYVAISERQVYFTAHACRTYGLEAGKYLHFLKDGKELFFIQNEDPDGFKLNDMQKGGSLAIFDRGLSKYLHKATGRGGTVKYFFGPADRKDEGRLMFEIYTNKTYSEVIKGS